MFEKFSFLIQTRNSNSKWRIIIIVRDLWSIYTEFRVDDTLIRMASGVCSKLKLPLKSVGNHEKQTL